MFEDKTLDPRDCKYELLQASELRQQIESLLEYNKNLVDQNENRDSMRSKEKETVLINRRSKTENNKIEAIDDDDDSSLEIANQLQMNKVDGLKNILQRTNNLNGMFNYEDLVELHRLLLFLDKNEKIQNFFYEFLEDNFRICQMPENRKNPLLDARLKQLKLKAATSDYNAMISNVKGYHSRSLDKLSLGEEIRNIKSTILATINAMMVIIATFFFFFFAIKYIRPDYEIGKLVLFSFGAATIVAIAEIYFLMRII